MRWNLFQCVVVLSSEQILALAPDDASAKASKGLLVAAKWPLLGFSDEAIWGECQGSGSKPYQVTIDLGGPTFKCTCPSRKFPCKHGLALFLLRIQKESAFTSRNAPAWVADWMSSRRDRAEKKAAKQIAQDEGQAPAPADPEAAAKREARRLERMIAGTQDLQRWLTDLVRHGLSDLPGKPATFWTQVAARLVDAQAGGLASFVLRLESTVHSGAGWPERLLAQLGSLQLLLDALQRFDTLPDALRAEVRTACGWPSEREEVLAAGERITDTWFIQGQSHEQNDRLWERRVWLRGRESRRQALLLDFSHGQRRFDQGFITGTWCQATLAFFPANHPLRTLVAERLKSASGPQRDEAMATTSWNAAFHEVAEAIAGNPWLQRLPLALGEVVPLERGGAWMARDGEDREVPLRVAAEDAWQLIALSGGHPMTIFGEWNGGQWRPLSAWSQGSTKADWLENITAS